MKKTLLLLALIFANISFAAESECLSLKNKIKIQAASSIVERAPILGEVAKLISNSENCAKNILGRLHYEGVYLIKNVEQAHAIFYDLSQQGYPPAIYNLAYLSIKEKRESPEEIVNLLHGLMVKFHNDSQWGYIAANARELAGDYIQDLRTSNLSYERKTILQEQHQRLAAEITSHLADLVKARTSEVREQTDAIATVLMAGVAAHSIGNNLAPARSARQLPVQQEPFAPKRYQVVPIGSPNLLYLIPHY